MEIFTAFISEYGTMILYTLLTAIAGFIGTAVKKVYTKYVNNKVKQDVAKTVVRAVEQIYKDLHGEEKLDMALDFFADMLNEQGITITELEMRMLLEAAVNEFNEKVKE